MSTSIIKVTDKGQLSLPASLRRMVGIHAGDQLIVKSSGSAIVLKKLDEDDFSDLLKHSENVALELWDNEDDENWNEV